eukprot:3084670-Prymnesium_polylepis.1
MPQSSRGNTIPSASPRHSACVRAPSRASGRVARCPLAAAFGRSRGCEAVDRCSLEAQDRRVSRVGSRMQNRTCGEGGQSCLRAAYPG